MSTPMHEISDAPGSSTINRGILLGVVITHIGLLAVFLNLSTAQDHQDTQPPVPLEMVMIEPISDPIPLPVGNTLDPTASRSNKPLATPSSRLTQPKQTKPVATAQPAPAPSAKPKPAASSQAAPDTASSAPAANSDRAITGLQSGQATAQSASGSLSGNEQVSSATTSGGQSATASTASASSSDTGGPLSAPRFGVAYLNNPAPKYPPIAKRSGVQGKVMLRVLVAANGTAKDVRLHTTSGSSVLDESAIAAVRRWRFIPAKRGDTAVEGWVQVPIVFELN